jgi:type II secretory pathway pseudopilin PulG
MKSRFGFILTETLLALMLFALVSYGTVQICMSRMQTIKTLTSQLNLLSKMQPLIVRQMLTGKTPKDPLVSDQTTITFETIDGEESKVLKPYAKKLSFVRIRGTDKESNRSLSTFATYFNDKGES